MDRRHYHNSFTGKMDRGRHRNRATETQSYIQTGEVAVPENRPLVHPTNNPLRGGYTNWNSENNEYSSSSRTQAPHLPQSFSGPYNDLSNAGNLNITPHFNSVISHSSDYDRYVINRNPYGPQDSLTRNRGALKRKGPESSVPYEIGSSSRSSEFSRRRSNLNVYYGHNEGPYCENGSFGGDSSRNVRRRSTLVLEDNQIRNNEFSYSSRYHYPPNYRPNYNGAANIGNMSSDGTNHNWNLGTMPHAVHGRVQTAGASGLSHRNNQLVERGSGLRTRVYRSDYVSVRDVTSFSQNVYAPGHYSRGQNSHSMRERPRYNADPNYSTRNEPTSAEDRHSLSSFRHSSQSSRGWENNYSGTHGRIGSEGMMMMDLSNFYACSHSFYDEYRDMRLDIDDMSYEELLELGESIGNVDTGLSDDVISLSLMDEAYSFGQISIEETCAICLEAYGNEVKIGTVKNCGHSYHADCIKKWLSMKNLCPICKAPAHKDYLNQE